MSIKVVGIVLFLAALYAFNFSLNKTPHNAVSDKGSEYYSLCDPKARAFNIPASLELPQIQDIPGFENPDSLVAFLQNEADSFSWKTFIALNWLATEKGEADSTVCFGSKVGTSVWQFWMPGPRIYVSPGEIPAKWQNGKSNVNLSGIKPGPGEMQPFNSGIQSKLRITKIDSNFNDLVVGDATNLDPDHFALIDRNHMYTLYENFYNRSAYDYIVKGKLYSKKGQQEFSRKWPYLTKGLTVTHGKDTINIAKKFSRAYFAIGNIKDSTERKKNLFNEENDTTTYILYFTKDIGAIIIKSAWVALTLKEDRSKYLTRTIKIKEKNGIKVRTLGLVGMHIMHKVAEQTQWVWSSFEHINNAPLLDSKGKPILLPGVDYLYFDESKYDTALFNKPPRSNYESNPFKRIPTQVVKIRDQEKSTELINEHFHKLIREADKNSMWLNYRLVGTQWALKSDLFEPGSQYQPHHLANAVLETYIQKKSSCMGCHSQARFLNDSLHYGYDADFVWGLSNVK